MTEHADLLGTARMPFEEFLAAVGSSQAVGLRCVQIPPSGSVLSAHAEPSSEACQAAQSANKHHRKLS